MTALLLLAPGTPMLFQGQEFGATAPFLFFADHNPELGPRVARGRREFLAQFPSLATPEAQRLLADPGSWETFARCKLDFGERERHPEIYALHRDLLALRHKDPAFLQQRWDHLFGAVLGPEAFLLRFMVRSDGRDRLLLVNLGRDLHLAAAPEPLLAAPAGCAWRTLWSSEDPRYGGGGTPPVERQDADQAWAQSLEGAAANPHAHDTWRVPGQAAVVLAAEPLPS